MVKMERDGSSEPAKEGSLSDGLSGGGGGAR